MTTFDGEEHRKLQDQFDSREIADVLAAAIVRPEIDGRGQGLHRVTNVLLPQHRQRGRSTDRVHEGGAAGFVQVLDPTTIVFPSYDGNGMFLSMGNIAADGRIGLLFMNFERPHRVRAHAHAVVNRDDPMMINYPGADLIVRATVKDVFVNCPRYTTPLPHAWRGVEVRARCERQCTSVRMEEDRRAPALPSLTIPRTRRVRERCDHR